MDPHMFARPVIPNNPGGIDMGKHQKSKRAGHQGQGRNAQEAMPLEERPEKEKITREHQISLLFSPQPVQM